MKTRRAISRLTRSFKKVGTLALLFILIQSLFPGALAIPEVSSPGAFFRDPQTINSLLAFENMSIQGIPLCWNKTTYDVYYAKFAPGEIYRTFAVWYNSNRTTKDLYTFSGTNIRSAIIANDGSILVALLNKTIYRSTDGGVTFTSTLNMAEGTNAWRMAIRGPYVYAIEYGVATSGNNQSIWRSSDNGKPGTWSIAAYTLNKSEGTNHWHNIYVDPHTNYVWATHGDTSDGLCLSKDGVVFTRFGPAIQSTAIAASPHNVFFGSDPGNYVQCYNKTTQEWQLLGRQYGDNRSFWSAFYEMTIGTEYVLYLRTVTEGIAGKLAYIYVSPDGRTLVPVRNETVYTNEHYRIIGPINGYIWFDDSNERGYIYRFRDISMKECLQLAYTPVLPSGWQDKMTLTYTHPERAFDGQNTYFHFASDTVRYGKLNIKGISVENLAPNSGAETVESFWDGANVNGYRQVNASAADKWNLTCSFDSSRSHSGAQSILVEGRNHTDYHGYLRLTRIYSPLTIPIGTPITFSAYYQMNNTDPDKNRQSGSVVIRGTFIYTDWSSIDIDMVGGSKSSMIGQNGNMTSDQWSRTWGTGITEKPIKWLLLDVAVYGFIKVWIDDIMIQLGPNLTPYVPDGTVYNTTDPSIVWNGKTYRYIGSLANNEVISFDIGALDGLYLLSVSCNESLVFEWSLVISRYTVQISEFILMILNITALGLFLAVAANVVIPITTAMKEHKPIKWDELQLNLIKSAVFISVGSVLLIMINQMFLG